MSEGDRDDQAAPDAGTGEHDGRNEAGGDSGKGGEDGKGGPPLYKRPLFWIVLIIVVATVAVGALLWWLNARHYESTDDAFVDAHIVRLTPQVSGQLVWVAPADNRHVVPGQLLARIEPSGPEAELQQSQAGVAEAQAGIEQADGRVAAAEAQRREAAANAVAPEAQAVRAANDYARYRTLLRLDRAAVAPTQLDAAKSQAESSAAQAAAARRAVDTAAANIAVARRQVAAARAEMQAARAKMASSRVTMGNLDIVAPVAGEVVNRNVNVGSFVSPQTQMMAIVPDEVWITANFKETQLAAIRVGQHVDIVLDAFPKVHFDGHVDSIQRGAGQAFALLPPQNATGNYVKVVQRVPVRILFDRMPDPHLFPIGPGMSVKPKIRVR
ncbi:MAG TPA: HlyD family secretion protein [Allosphingosinicella sp.]|nr:HlyD family secretion protein [Allosphingosinicella sp.]